MKFAIIKQTKIVCLSFFLTLFALSGNQKICNAASYVVEDEHIKVTLSIERNVSPSEYPRFLSGYPKNGYEYIMAQITLVSLKDVNICAGKSVMDGLILYDSGNLIYNIISCQIQGIEFQDIHDIKSNARLIEGSIFQSFFEIPKGRELFKFDFIYPYGNTGWGDCINQGQVEIILIPHSSQQIYRNSDQIEVYIPSPLEGYTRYVGLSLPDGTLLIFTDLNTAVLFDSHSLPSWKGKEVMLDLQNRPGIPRGEYTVYSLQVPTGVDPLTFPPEALLATTKFKIE